MKVRDDGHLEGARSMCHFLREICIILRHFLGILTGMGHIHWVGVQTWLRGSHAVKCDGHLEGARLLLHFSMQIYLTSCHFLGTLTEVGPIHWVGVCS